MPKVPEVPTKRDLVTPSPPAVLIEPVEPEVVSVLPVTAREVALAAPRVGVTRVGEVENTRLVEVVPVVPPAERPVILLKQVIVAEEQFVPPLATGRTPVTPVVSGRPVRLVATPDAGVPKAGVTKVGLVARTTLPLPVVASSPKTPELLYSIRPLVPLEMVVVPTTSEEATAVTVQVLPRVQVWPLTVVAALTKSALVTKPVAVKEVVIVGEAIDGEVIVGEVERTTLPEPVIAYSPRIPELSYRTRVLVPPEIGVVPTVMAEANELEGTGPAKPPPTVPQTLLAGKIPLH